MKIYLAGPMRGLPEFNFPAFRKWAAFFRYHEIEVVSPHENDAHEGAWAKEYPSYDPSTGDTGESDHRKALRFFMQKDLPMMLSCDAVINLPGWEKSKGAFLENYVANYCGIPTYDLVSFVEEHL